MRFVWPLLLSWFAVTSLAAADLDPQSWLDRKLVVPQLAWQESQAYCRRHIPPIPILDRADSWTAYADEVRERVLSQVVLRGEAEAWNRLPTRVEWLDTIEANADYRIKKLRFEAVPGLWIPALLYEPTKLAERVPVFLNVNGHDRAGKAAGYKQARCINLARRGIVALNLEWVGMGQLRHDDLAHTRMNQLDLCGTSGVAPFYLSMKRALDILLEHPQADPERVGVAGLSGGGWQTIFISALDTRVTLSNPVAGYSSFLTRIDQPADLGDSEQTPVDLGVTADYALLTALLAPRAALLTFNARDNCCFAAGHALPPLLDAARPAYRLFNRENELRWHVNHVPGDHNFGVDNREALYRVVGDTFFPGDKQYPRHELPIEGEILSAEALHVPLPDESATFHSLALKLAQGLPRIPPRPENPAEVAKWRKERREQLVETVRLPTWSAAAERVDTASEAGVTITTWRLRVGEAWTVPAVEFAPADPIGVSLLIGDQGRTKLADDVRRELNARRRVVAFDPWYWGESKVSSKDWLWALMLSTVGDRPVGVQAGQINALARWSQVEHGGGPVKIVARGGRAALAGLVSAATEPNAIGSIETHDAPASLHDVLRRNLTVIAEPEWFCFGLLEHFDFDRLRELARDRE